MNCRSSRRTLAAALLALAALGAHAGPSLDASLTRAAQAHADDGVAALTPQEGLFTALSGPGADAPWLVPGGAPGRLESQWLSPQREFGRLRLRTGLAWREEGPRGWSLDGSLLALDLGPMGEVYASVERRHWGPGWLGSLILDGAAPALPALGWRRDEPARSEWAGLRWLGPWSADVFVARLRGHVEPQRPLLIGMRLQFEPSDALTIGLSRTMQWGGRGRDEGWRSLVNALIGRDNTGEYGLTPGNEPGNQLAGIDWRWTADATWSLYGQVVGEDEAGLLPSRNMALLGVDWRPQTTGSALRRVFVEAVDTRAGGLSANAALGGSYRHPAFEQGYSSEGQLLGHPAGGDLRLASLGALWQHGPWGAMAALSAGRAEPSAQRFAAGPVAGVNGALHLDLDASQRIGLGAWWWRESSRGSRGAAQLWWQHRHR
jgi:Capsule assembly protein Wzi